METNLWNQIFEAVINSWQFKMSIYQLMSIWYTNIFDPLNVVIKAFWHVSSILPPAGGFILLQVATATDNPLVV